MTFTQSRMFSRNRTMSMAALSLGAAAILTTVKSTDSSSNITTAGVGTAIGSARFRSPNGRRDGRSYTLNNIDTNMFSPSRNRNNSIDINDEYNGYMILDSVMHPLPSPLVNQIGDVVTLLADDDHEEEEEDMPSTETSCTDTSGFNTVCGTDGLTYMSSCHLEMSSILNDRLDIAVSHIGICGLNDHHSLSPKKHEQECEEESESCMDNIFNNEIEICTEGKVTKTIPYSECALKNNIKFNQCKYNTLKDSSQDTTSLVSSTIYSTDIILARGPCDQQLEGDDEEEGVSRLYSFGDSSLVSRTF